MYCSTQTYLNSPRDLLEAQFKGMTFPGRVSPHLARKCLWHPIKSAQFRIPASLRMRWLCLWGGQLHSGQCSENLFGVTECFTRVSTFTSTLIMWSLYLLIYQMMELKYKESACPATWVGEPDQRELRVSDSRGRNLKTIGSSRSGHKVRGSAHTSCHLIFKIDSWNRYYNFLSWGRWGSDEVR